MRQGQIYVNMTGRRKPTSYRCNRCTEKYGETVWHDTHRGPGSTGCPFEEPDPPQAPTLIEQHKMGTFGTRRPKRRIHLNMADIIQDGA